MPPHSAETPLTPEVEALWHQVHDALRRFIARRVATEADVEDILQDVSLRIHRHLARLRTPERLMAWIFQMTRHAIVDYYRAPARRHEIPTGLDADRTPATAVALPLPDPEGETAQLREELAACLRPLLARLPTPYREAVTMVELAGLTQHAAAKQLGLSVSGMKSRVQRGRQQLHRLLNDCCLIHLDRRNSVTDYTMRAASCQSCGSAAESGQESDG